MEQFVLEYFVDNGILDDSVINDFEVDMTSADQKEVHLARMKHELDLAKLNQELEMKKLEKGIPSSVSTGVPKFDVTKHIRLVPHFSEDNVDKYFIMFEKVAKSLTWPKDQWVLLLQSVLKGKAQETYSALSVSDCDSYDTVKQAILKSYELVPEAYRQRFRNLKKSEGQTFVEYARDKEVLFDRWCASREVVDDFENLKQLIIVEEFERCIHNDIRTHLDESNVTDLRAAAIKADDYALTHKSNLNQSKHNVSMRRNNGQGFSARQYTSDKSKEGFPPRQFSNDGKNKEGFPPRQSANDSKGKEATKSGGQFLKSDNLVGPCWYCKENGHTRANCRAWIAAGRPSTKSVGHVTTPQVSSITDSVNKGKGSSNFGVMAEYIPFMSKGQVRYDSLNKQPQATSINILRDTGAAQSLILHGAMPHVAVNGETVLIKGVVGDFISIPYVEVNLCSGLVNGPVKIGLTDSLPMKGVDMLLGNDLAGHKVLTSPHMTCNPTSSDDTEAIENDFPGISPACVTTRSGKSTSDDVIDISDSFFSKLVNDDKSVIQEESSDHSAVSVDNSSGGDVITRSNLISTQKNDPELESLYSGALSETEAASYPCCYFIQNDVLMRKRRPPDASVDDEWLVQYQIVVPSPYRSHILNLAHDIPMAGHLGVRKTYLRVLEHFCSPGLKKDVVNYCRTCHTCQVIGKPNQKPPKAPLRPIPAFKSSFSELIIDCVGPLPKSKSGKQYLLTIMCASTLFPEAIPLSNIRTPAICEALKCYFSRVGLPISIRSDQGSNFQSHKFKQFLKELGIEQKKSSAWHPESQGALERFHQTFKTMLKCYCEDHERDWDVGVPLLLFAVRDSTQESLGFSPFQLVFGHKVRGPLKLIKEK